VTASPAELAGVTAITPTLHDELVHRAANDGLRWLEQVEHAGYCRHPIRLSGSVRHIDKASGEVRVAYATGNEPDGVLLVRCGNRRVAVCPSCGGERGTDAFQLVKAGLVGGKGVPDTVGSHPKLFVTLTAPGFGAVHARRAQGKNVAPCHPRRGTCPHGRPLGCFRPHKADEDCLGQPLCIECFAYRRMVVWNTLAPELWRRTRIAIERALPGLVGMRAKDVEQAVKLQYVKVGEYQGRGAVHFHAVMRLDARPPKDDPERVEPPPAAFTTDVLARAVELAAQTTKAPCPPFDGMDEPYVRWGPQIDIHRLRGAGPGDLTEEAVARYVAKYATKGTEGFAARLNHRLSAVDLDDLDDLGASPHVERIVRACWELGGDQVLEEQLHLRKWAHCLGFGGHWLTKSRRYSTTFKAFNGERREVARRRHFADGVPVDAFGRPESEDNVVVLADWAYMGSGYRTTGEKWLALSAAAWARERKRVAKEELRTMRPSA
jgi:replication initiator protein RepSA